MRVVLNNQDISNLIIGVKWQGDISERSRSVGIDYLYKLGSRIPNVEAANGDTIALYDESNKRRFIGIITSVSSSLAGKSVSVTARDVLWYLGRNKVSGIYEGSADVITKKILSSFNIPVEKLAVTNINKQIISTGDKTIYEVIKEAYGDDYYIAALDNKITVVKNAEQIVAVISGSENLIDASYKKSIESMVNKVIIIDDSGNKISEVENSADLKYGLMQDVYKKEEKKDPITEAKAKLVGIVDESSIEAIGNWECVAGMGIYVMDTTNAMLGKFLITDDSHTFKDGTHYMSLGIKKMEV